MRINEFLATIAGLSDNTIRAYRQTLWLLWAHMQSMDGALDPSTEPEDRHVLNFLSKYSGNTLHRHKAGVTGYYQFLGREWPFGKRMFSAPRRRVPRYTNPGNVQLLIDAAENEHDKMFVETLFQLGCRISELRGIEKQDISQSGVLVTTKGGHQRLKPTTAEFRTRLEQYAKKQKGKIFHYSYAYYFKRLKQLGQKVGVPEISPHILRHARAVDLLRKGMSLTSVQQFLGHANLNTTAIYLEITSGELGEELEKVESGGK